MKVALIHDYLIDFGGAERVLLALHRIYPEAPIFVSIYRPKLLGEFAEKFKNAKIIQSWFGYVPFAEKLISPFRFLLPLIWKSFNLKKYDLIISSASWAATKGFEKKAGAVEVCYCHTPPRYLYGYETSRKFTGILGNLVVVYGAIINHFMRMYDFNTARKVDYFIANSKNVAKRIKKFYRRDAVVIYPPVEIPEVSIASHSRGGYYLAGGRLVAAKNFDLIISTFNKLNLPLKIYGNGILRGYLGKMAGKNIEFLGKVDDVSLDSLYRGAEAFILAQKDEDFGLTAVEAQAAGTPVIAFRGGGYTESIIEGKTGVFFDKPTPESLTGAIKKFNSMKIKPEDCIVQAKKFSKERFMKEIKAFVKKYA
ncbi:MAG: glycosyltransferase [bacterium]|nr:glycosyltransferase [bacterium]